VAVPVVLGLYTSVLTNANEVTLTSAGLLAVTASFHEAGDVAAKWEAIALDWREVAVRAEEKASMEVEADEEESTGDGWREMMPSLHIISIPLCQIIHGYANSRSWCVHLGILTGLS
jgi:hypothetical protein